MIGLYTKAILAACVAAATALTTALQDGTVTTYEWVAVAGALVVGLGAVWAVPNVPESVRVYGKAAVSGVTAGLAALGTALLDGAITPGEWVTLITALVVGSGLVGIAPNAAASDGLIEYPDDEDEDDLSPLPDDSELPPNPV